MKKILAVVIMLFSVCYADEIKFLEIPFGSSEATVRKEMNTKGWKLKNEDNNAMELDEYNIMSNLFFLGNDFAGKEVKFVNTEFLNDRLYSVTIYFKDGYNTSKIINAYIKKYNLIEEETPYFSVVVEKYKTASGKEYISFVPERNELTITNSNYSKMREPDGPSQEEIDADI